MVDIAKRARPWRRDVFIFLAVIGLIGAGCYFGRAQFLRWRADNFAHQARGFLEKHDAMSAALTAQRGLRADAKSVACWKLLAEIAEAYGQKEAIYSRSRVVDLEPGSLDAVLDCAGTALRFGDPQAALDVLNKLGEDRRNEPRYQFVRGQVETALDKTSLAVDSFANALKLDPQNQSYRLAHAAALLERAWLEDRAGARATLEQLAEVPSLRLAALRVLLKDLLAHGETAASLATARQLVDVPGAEFREKVVLVDLLHRSNSEDFPAVLASVEKAARGKTSYITQVATWMFEKGRHQEAIEWSKDFSPQEWSDPRVCGAVAMNILAAHDWASLESFTRSGDWGRLEYLRQALLTRALREEGKYTESRGRWMMAANAAAQVPGEPAELLQLITSWGWDSECDDLLRTLLKDPKQAVWASLTLYRRLEKRNDTYGLWEVTARLVEIDPGNDVAVNNFASFSLLLNKDVSRASQLAQKLYAKHPGEAKYVSTYAFSLYCRGHADEAVRVMNTLGSEYLQEPDIAVYYGVMLAESGDTERAAFFLGRAAGADLLPEERALAKRAQEKLNADAAPANGRGPAKSDGRN